MLLYMFLFIGSDKLVAKKVRKRYAAWKYLPNDGMSLTHHSIDRYHATNQHCIGETLALMQGHAQVSKLTSNVKQFHPISRLVQH